MEDKHIPKALLPHTTILGVRFQHKNFGRTKAQLCLHSIPCSPLQKRPTSVTCTHPQLQCYARGHTHPVTCACAHTHTAKSYFHTDSHTESYSHANTQSRSFTPIPSAQLCPLPLSESQLHPPSLPLPTPADIHPQSQGLLWWSAQPQMCFTQQLFSQPQLSLLF